MLNFDKINDLLRKDTRIIVILISVTIIAIVGGIEAIRKLIVGLLGSIMSLFFVYPICNIILKKATIKDFIISLIGALYVSFYARLMNYNLKDLIIMFMQSLAVVMIIFLISELILEILKKIE